MCRFITAVLPNDADIEAVASVFKTHRRTCVAYVNRTLAAQIGRTESTFFTTRWLCDCDTLLGSSGVQIDPVDTREADAARWRRKGWSEAKIARALDQRNDANSRPRSAIRRSTQTSLDEWCALIRDTVVASTRARYVGLLLHDYHGGLNDEEIVLQERIVVRAGKLDEAVLAAIAEDTIYEFRR